MTNKPRKSHLLEEVQAKLDQAKSNPKPARRRSAASTRPSTRAAVNRANATKSTGPNTAEGKQASAANSLKHGFFANIEHLDPRNAPAFESTLADLRTGLHPDGPARPQRSGPKTRDPSCG